jgi:hypothetical protein
VSNFIAVYDACVLYPAPLRDFLVRLAGKDLFQAKWTSEIQDEWIRNLLKERTDLTAERLLRTRELMEKAVPDCLVCGYEDFIPAITLPDPGDRHVVAAAVRAKAAVIVTMNLKHFPPDALAKYDLTPQHPDDFVMDLLDLAPATVCSVAREQRASLKNPAKTVDQHLATLEQQGLRQTVLVMRKYLI